VSKDRPKTGIDGVVLPILPPDRDARVWARLVRVMFYLPGFMALLLIKAGEPASFGITVELLMLSSGAAIVGGLFIGAQSSAPALILRRRLAPGAGRSYSNCLPWFRSCAQCRRYSTSWQTASCCIQ
jgi:hypothetical protein